MELKDVIIKIQQVRDKAKLSARELSLRIGKDSSYIAKVEAHTIKPSMEVVLDIIEACDTTPEAFFYRDFLTYQKDKELLDYFSRLTDKQKDAILNLYKD